MNNRFKYKKIIFTTLAISVGVVTFLVYNLAGLKARPVQYAIPPTFVNHYAAEMVHSDGSTIMAQFEPNNVPPEVSEITKLKGPFSNEETLILKVILDGDSPDILLRQFTHPVKAQRIKIASAFASVNSKLTHDEESGFPDKRELFWKNVKAYTPDIQNALYEALIYSAETGISNYIPYTLAWMPGQDHKTVEMLTWAAEHHPDWWVRRFSVYFVVKFGQNERLARQLIKSRTHDPDYRVRKQVLELRIERFI